MSDQLDGDALLAEMLEQFPPRDSEGQLAALKEEIAALNRKVVGEQTIALSVKKPLEDLEKAYTGQRMKIRQLQEANKALRTENQKLNESLKVAKRMLEAICDERESYAELDRMASPDYGLSLDYHQDQVEELEEELRRYKPEGHFCGQGESAEGEFASLNEYQPCDCRRWNDRPCPPKEHKRLVEFEKAVIAERKRKLEHVHKRLAGSDEVSHEEGVTEGL